MRHLSHRRVVASRDDHSTRRTTCGLRVTLLITAITCLLAGSGLFAASPYLVYQTAPGAALQLYSPSTGAKITLAGTEKMGNPIVADVDGDGLENDIVYTSTTAGGLGYYKIPSDPNWHSERDFAVPGVPRDAIPLTVLRLGTAGAGVIYFNSPSAGKTYAVMPNGTGLSSMTKMDRAFAVDVRQQGYKGDIVWWTSGVGMSWREGIYGLDHKDPWGNLMPLGGGKIVSSQPQKTIAFFPVGGDVIYVCDRNWNYTRLDGTAWPWSVNLGSIVFGDVTNDGIADILYTASATDPLRCYRVPSNGAPWDPNAVSTDNSLQCGWGLRGVASADITSSGTTTAARVADLRRLADGTKVTITKPRTKLVRERNSSGAIVTTGYYVEETDRSSGIRVVGSTAAPEGGLVTVQGSLSTVSGERVIVATSESVSTQSSVVSPLTTSVKSLYGTLAMTGLLVRLAGSITAADVQAGSFTFSDGYTKTLKVYCPDSTLTTGKITLTGCVGAEKNTSGVTIPVLRVEAAASGVVPVGTSTPPPTVPPPTTGDSYFVWTRPSLQKVVSTDATLTLGSTKINAAGNEHESFQIVLRGATTAIKAVTLTVSNLTGSAGSIPAANVKLYQPYYIYLPYYSKSMPDPLPAYKPFDLAAGQTQPIWVDVFVPKGTAAGDYTGTVSISSTNGKATSVPYTLHVYNFTLPDGTKLATQFDFYDYYMAPKEGVTYGSAACRTLWKQYYEFLLDRGISTAALPVDDFHSAEAATYMKDARLTSFRIPYSSNVTDQARIFNTIKANGAWGKGFADCTDEVFDQASYTNYKNKATYYRGIDSTVPTMCTYYSATPNWTTQHTTDILAGYASIWCPISGGAFEESRLAARRALGEKVWTYICTNPDGRTPNFFLQDPAISHRIIAWQCYFHQATGWLYWHTNYWNDVTDPWTDICTGKGIDSRLYGEGSLVYPGKVHTGTAGPVSSIRLEVFRDSLEDYKYMWLLEQKLGRSQVMTYVQQLVTDWWTYSKDPAQVESIRDSIARKIEN